MGCVEHGYAGNPEGYGQQNYRGKVVLSHRLAYALKHGLDVFTMGGVVMHSCDNPRCITEDHLTLGTQADNVADMIAKGRSKYLQGEAHGSAKITDKQVEELRSRYSPPGTPGMRYGNGKALCAEFGISKQNLSILIRREAR